MVTSLFSVSRAAALLGVLIPTSDGCYQIKNANSALDVNVAGALTTNGAAIVQWQFGTQGNDQWLPVRQSDGSYVFYNRNSGSLLDNPGGTTHSFQFDQWGANNGADQKFGVTKQMIGN